MLKTVLHTRLLIFHSNLNHLEWSLAWLKAANGGIAGFTVGSGAAQWNCAIVTHTHCHCLRQAGPGANGAFVSMPDSGEITMQPAPILYPKWEKKQSKWLRSEWDMQKSCFNIWLSVSHSKINHLKCSLAWMRVANGGIAGFTDGSGAVQWNCDIVTRTRCHCPRRARPVWLPVGANAAFVSMPDSDMIARLFVFVIKVRRTVCSCYKGSSKWPDLDVIPPDSGELNVIGRVRRDHYAGRINSPAKMGAETIKMVEIWVRYAEIMV